MLTTGLSSPWSSPPQTTGSGTNVIKHFTAVIYGCSKKALASMYSCNFNKALVTFFTMRHYNKT
jgi:hypothetical protein